MASIFDCPHAVQDESIVRCGIYIALHKEGLTLNQLDHSLQSHSLALKGGGGNTQCGFDRPERQSCIGAHVPRYRLGLLFAAVRDKIVFVHVENKVSRARVFDAGADSFFQ